MGRLELFLLAVGLSMDAMAAAICRGLVVPKGRCTPGQALITGAWFGGFQALMPTVGYFLGQHFCAVVSRVDHWIAFFLLGAIGLHMLREAHHADEPSISDTGASGGAFGVRTMMPLAVATSIDAMAVGVTFAFLGVSIIPAAALIGLATFLLSCGGVFVGQAFGGRYHAIAERIGGITLILMGGRILATHTLGW